LILIPDDEDAPQAETFIAQPAIEGFVGRVLRRLSRIDQRRVDGRFSTGSLETLR